MTPPDDPQARYAPAPSAFPVPAPAAGPGQLGQMWVDTTPPPISAVPRRRDRGVLGVGVAFLVAGLVQAVLWSLLAPGRQIQLLDQGRYAVLGGSFSTAQFTSIAVFVLLGVVLAVTIAVAAWRVRTARGPRMLLTVLIGSLLGGVIAWGLATMIAPGTDLHVAAATGAVGDVFTERPVTGSLLVLCAQAGLATAVYTFLAAWNGTPGLGRLTRAQDGEPSAGR
ncbi:DUF2567 domain-containing protein [Nakamurella flavida]|uniref:DUF2567 domain-containing protein n=1 Tax=Nakamurella flavida TaxID=363630 RepID=A0A938YEC2_9ACTN|nr:DUF2567 domain-containing protein [Nakamurella flavida]MBM9476105.1 DUF2567 domain-containing protein [Nakamurella flavida]MDP9777150.1 hypothetical protein [Nakamurella flavida]